MYEITGDLFSTNLRAIGHGTNCYGVMGAGVAKLVAEKYPYTFERYQNFCSLGGTRPRPGVVQSVEDGDKVIFNIFTQDMPGPHARYEYILGAAISTLEILKNRHNEKYIAIPRIGSGIGGLRWVIVRELLMVAEDIVSGGAFNGGPQFVVYTPEES